MSGSKSNSAAKNKTNTAVDCMSTLGKFLVCLCFLRVGVGVGAMKKAYVLKWLPEKRTRENRTSYPGKGEEPGLRDPTQGDRDSVLHHIRTQKSAGYQSAAQAESVAGPSIPERSAWDSQQLAETGRGLEAGPRGLAAAHDPQPTSWSAHAPPVRG